MGTTRTLDWLRPSEKPPKPLSVPSRYTREDRLKLFISRLRYAPMMAEWGDTPYYLADVEMRLRELENAERN